MSYTSVETSVQEGLPVEVYKFVGTYKTYRYTDADRAMTFFGEIYEPIAISREEATTGDQSQDGVEMIVQMPQTVDLVKDYVFNISPPDLNLTIYRCHAGLNFAVDPIVFWTGPVTGFSVEEDIAKVRIPSILESVFSGNMPNFFYQQSCNHTLYDDRCRVDKVANTITTYVTSIDGQNVTVADQGFADGYLKGGIIAIPGINEKRLILGNAANVINVFYPFSKLTVGDSVELSAGCDHSKATCKAKFNNVRRFGGFPYIPQDNPFVGNLTS
jgi:uncharacterized phage protein (TIGR02218 family)